MFSLRDPHRTTTLAASNLVSIFTVSSNGLTVTYSSASAALISRFDAVAIYIGLVGVCLFGGYVTCACECV